MATIVPTINQVAYSWTLLFTSLSAAIVYKFGWRSRDTAQRNTQFRQLQRRFLIPYLLVLLAESIQAPYLYVLYHVYGYLPSQIAVLYIVGMAMNVFSTVLTLHLLMKYGRRMLCLICVASGSFACLLKFSDNYLVLLIGRLLDGFSAALILTPFQQWYGHEHSITYDFPKEWLSTTFSLLSLSAGFLAILAGIIVEFAEIISQLAAFPFFFAILFQLAGGCCIMWAWPENKLILERSITLKEQFVRAVAVFKKKPNLLLLCVIHTLFESTLMIFIFIWAPIFLHSKRLNGHRISYGGVYAAFMSSAVFGTIIYRFLQRRFFHSYLLFISSSLSLSLLMLTIVIIPSQMNDWTMSLFDSLLALFCCFESVVSIYVSAMNNLQADLLPGEDRAILLATLRIPLTVISGAGMLFLHSGENDLHLIVMQCILLTMSTLTALILHLKMVKRTDTDLLDHFVLNLSTETYDSIEDEGPHGISVG